MLLTHPFVVALVMAAYVSLQNVWLSRYLPSYNTAPLFLFFGTLFSYLYLLKPVWWKFYLPLLIPLIFTFDDSLSTLGYFPLMLLVLSYPKMREVPLLKNFLITLVWVCTLFLSVSGQNMALVILGYTLMVFPLTFIYDLFDLKKKKLWKRALAGALFFIGYIIIAFEFSFDFELAIYTACFAFFILLILPLKKRFELIYITDGLLILPFINLFSS